MAGQHKGVGYPNSAAFVRGIWKKHYSLLLCEIDPSTTNAINNWLPGTRRQPQCTCAKLFEGDWRDGFKQGLPSPADVSLPKNSFTLVPFDPHLYSRHPHGRPNGEGSGKYEDIIRPQHLDLTLLALNKGKGGIFIQLSTYTANGNNRQEDVINSVSDILTPCGFHLQAKVRPALHNKWFLIPVRCAECVLIRGFKGSSGGESLAGRLPFCQTLASRRACS